MEPWLPTGIGIRFGGARRNQALVDTTAIRWNKTFLSLYRPGCACHLAAVGQLAGFLNHRSGGRWQTLLGFIARPSLRHQQKATQNQPQLRSRLACAHRTGRPQPDFRYPRSLTLNWNRGVDVRTVVPQGCSCGPPTTDDCARAGRCQRYAWSNTAALLHCAGPAVITRPPRPLAFITAPTHTEF